LPPDQILADNVDGDSAAKQAGLIRFDDIAPLQFASDAQDDGSYLSRRYHDIDGSDAVSTDAALDSFFAQI
jgi:hypothetical protein